MRVLSAAQRQQFDDEGFVVVHDVLDPILDIGPVLAEYADLLDEIALGLYAAGTIDLAINVHTFSALTDAAVGWWAQQLAHLDVPYVVTVSCGRGGDYEHVVSSLERMGYQLTVKEPVICL